jgi:glycerophosphoryl diester phosphodiesterase
LASVRARRTLVCAHRGASADHADNSVAAFEAAIAAGADLIETDVRRAADGTLVCAHDPVETGETYVPVETLLALARGRIGLDLEIKEEGVEADLLQLLRPEDRAARLVVTSFLPGALAACRRLDPALDLGLLIEAPAPIAPARLARSCGANFLCPDLAAIDHPVREAARLLDRRLAVWTVNEPEDIATLARDRDVFMITTDVPALARAVISGL